MSAFYGQVSGSAETTASRRGTYNSGIESSVQSWNGSIITALYYDDDDKLMVDVAVDEGSSFCGHTIFIGPFDEFVKRLER